MSLRILADENIPALQDYFGAYGQVQTVAGRDIISERLRDADVLLVRSVTRVDEHLLGGTSVKFVGTATSGFDHVDREYLGAAGITFAYAPGSNANSVVEYVLAAIAVCGEKLEQLLAGGSVGIVGYGMIGRALAARLDALDIDHRVYDPWLMQADIPAAATLEQVLGCDVVSLHPQLCSTPPWPSHHLLGTPQLRALCADCLLINASRGPVVDNAALLALLESGAGPHCVLDTWEGEPTISAPLLERVALGSAHIAGYSLDGKLNGTRQLALALAAYLGQVAERIPGASLPPLSVPQDIVGADLIRHLLQSRYDIRRDDELLRAAVLGAGNVESGRAFDQLRKHYRERRELAGSEVAVAGSASATETLVRSLGCAPAIFQGGL